MLMIRSVTGAATFSNLSHVVFLTFVGSVRLEFLLNLLPVMMAVMLAMRR